MVQIGRLAGLSALLLASWLPALSPQVQAEILHYGFDEGKGLSTANKARGPIAGPASGKIVSTNKKQWRDPGRLGWALHSIDDYDYSKNVVKSWNYVETGWTQKLEGSFSVGFYFYKGLDYARLGAFYLFGGDDGFRCFTDGRAGTGLSVAGWGGNYLDLRQDLRGAAKNKWVHVALVVDDKKRIAIWYVDGVEKARERIFDKPVIKARKGFRIGSYDRPERSTPWHLDEFRLVAGVATPLDIKAWSLRSVSYGSACKGAQLGPVNASPPKLGTNKFALRVRAAPKALSLIGLGFSGTKLGAIPLPLALDKVFGDSWKGCSLQSSFDILIPNVLGQDGIGYKPIALPNDATLAGFTLYAQAIVLGKAASAQATTNGWIFSIVD